MSAAVDRAAKAMLEHQQADRPSHMRLTWEDALRHGGDADAWRAEARVALAAALVVDELAQELHDRDMRDTQNWHHPDQLCDEDHWRHWRDDAATVCAVVLGGAR